MRIDAAPGELIADHWAKTIMFDPVFTDPIIEATRQ